MSFTKEEQKALYEKIEQNYFRQNFGSMSKADFETLIFSEYIEHRIKNGEPFDDYTLSKELGITQARIRTLKERKELKYPYEDFSWRESFCVSVRNAKYDETDHYIKMIIEDVNVMNEIRHYIEQKGWYDECSLNKKLLKIPLECFLEICYMEDEISQIYSKETIDVINGIAEKYGETVKLEQESSKDKVIKFLKTLGKNAMSEVLTSFPGGNLANAMLTALADTIRDS